MSVLGCLLLFSREHYERGRTLYSKGDKSHVPELKGPLASPGDGQAVYWLEIVIHLIGSGQGSSRKDK